jgi:hypothetical protein
MFESNSEVLKKWAAAKYDLNEADIDTVDFDIEVESFGYCETCGYDAPVLEVVVRFKGKGETTFSESQYYTTELINSILDVARGEA